MPVGNRLALPLVIAALACLGGMGGVGAKQPAPPAPKGVVIENESVGAVCYRAAARGHGDQQAFEVCTRAIRAARTRIQRTAATVNRGVVLYNGGAYERAIADYTTVIEAYRSRNPIVFVNRGLSYEQARPGDPDYEASARADYETALSISPNHRVAARRLDALKRPFIERGPLPSRPVV